MHVEIISIGDELLAGHTLNTNAREISQALHRIGLTPSSQRVIPDSKEEICQALRESLKHVDLILITGGLGPTLDDLTRSAVVEVVGGGLHYDAEVARRLEERYGQGQVPALEDQATIPDRAEPLHNRVGTAPGLLFSLQEGKQWVVLLPGVPMEMRGLLEEELLPRLRKWVEGTVSPSCELHFMQLRESDIDQAIRPLATQHPEIQFGIYPSVGSVTLRMTSPSREAIECVAEQVGETFRGKLFESPNGTLEGALHQLLTERGQTLALAESCTGGALATRFTKQSGASCYFLGSLVTYSNSMKAALLGVQAETLRQHGAVSRECAAEMVRGVLAQSGADFGVAITGIAGPSGETPEKPVGRVYIAVGRAGGEERVFSSSFLGNRESIIARSCSRALAELYRLVQESGS